MRALARITTACLHRAKYARGLCVWPRLGDQRPCALALLRRTCKAAPLLKTWRSIPLRVLSTCTTPAADASSVPPTVFTTERKEHGSGAARDVDAKRAQCSGEETSASASGRTDQGPVRTFKRWLSTLRSSPTVYGQKFDAVADKSLELFRRHRHRVEYTAARSQFWYCVRNERHLDGPTFLLYPVAVVVSMAIALNTTVSFFAVLMLAYPIHVALRSAAVVLANAALPEPPQPPDSLYELRTLPYPHDNMLLLTSAFTLMGGSMVANCIIVWFGWGVAPEIVRRVLLGREAARTRTITFVPADQTPPEPTTKAKQPDALDPNKTVPN